MSKIWVRNIITDDIDKVGSLSYGSDNWEKAYAEMIQKGYKFQIGEPLGLYKDYYGLYLINPLDINIMQSEYRVINDLNEKIKELQESSKEEELAEEQRIQNYSLIDWFNELEDAYGRARFHNGPAMMFAPDEAINSMIESQQEAYNGFIKSLKASTPEERKSILGKVFSSEDLTEDAKLGIILEIVKISEELLPNQDIIINQNLINCFNELEGEYKRARINSGAAMMFAPDEAINSMIKSQQNAYNRFIEAMKASTPEERKSILENVFASNDLTNNAMLAIVKEVLESLGELTFEEEVGIAR